MMMSTTDTTSNEVAASWAKSSLERAGLNSEVLLNAMALNEHGHKIRLRNDLGDMNLTSGRSDDLLGIKTEKFHQNSSCKSRKQRQRIAKTRRKKSSVYFMFDSCRIGRFRAG